MRHDFIERKLEYFVIILFIEKSLESERREKSVESRKREKVKKKCGMMKIDFKNRRNNEAEQRKCGNKG